MTDAGVLGSPHKAKRGRGEQCLTGRLDLWDAALGGALCCPVMRQTCNENAHVLPTHYGWATYSRPIIAQFKSRTGKLVRPAGWVIISCCGQVPEGCLPLGKGAS